MANPVNLTGYHLTFDAEMTTSADMAKFSNAFINGDRRLYANHEQQYYVDYNTANPANPFSFGNGALTITASPTPSGDQPYTSGLIQTANSFSQNQGYFEIRAKTPSAQGFWPAFWMITPNYYPEIDVLEQPNNSGTDTKYWATINTPEDYSGGFNDTGTSLSTGYHSYGFMWNANTIQFTFDGNYIGYAHNTPASLATAQMYLLANLAVGDSYSWPGAPITGASAALSIDYIRAYSNDPSKPAVALQPISSPDGANTAPNLGTPTATTPTTQTIGSGPDQFIFQVSEDAYNGDAQFTITIDGVAIGGVLTTTAAHAAAQAQSFVVNGSFGTGSHAVSLSFINDAYGGSSTTDRNFYVTSASYNGSAMTPGSATLLSNGSANFSKAATGAPAAAADITVGSGPDSFVFKMSEDAYQGDAQFTVTVDGVQQGGILTTTAAHAAGQSQNVTINGSFSSAVKHSVQVNFLNDAYGGAGAGQDRNLFVDAASFDGTAMTPGNGALFSNGALTFATPGAAHSDTLTLAMAEDAFQGDARAEISIDGRVLGQVTVTAPNAGTPQQVSFAGDFGGAGPHTVGVNFLNDAYGGDGADRNLFVKGITFDGTLHADATANMFSGGLKTFSI